MKSKLITIALILQACGSMLDISGKGAKRECLKLNTAKNELSCDCDGNEIKTINIYNNKSKDENFGDLIYKSSLDSTVNKFVLPISKENANERYLQIEVHLSNSHHRESYYIYTKPGDYTKQKTIYSKYFSH